MCVSILRNCRAGEMQMGVSLVFLGVNMAEPCNCRTRNHVNECVACGLGRRHKIRGTVTRTQM